MRESLSIRSDLAELERARPKVEAFLGAQFEVLERNRLILALDEALANIIEHSYRGDSTRTIELGMEITEEAVVFTIEDDGEHFDPTVGSRVDLESHAAAGHTRGLGIYLFTTLMEARHETRKNGGNRLVLTHALPRTREQV